MRTLLANLLQDTNHPLEISHMERRQDKSHMAEMAVANLQRTAAGLAGRGLVRNTHAPVERAMRNNGSVIFEVVEFAVGYFHHALADNVIVGPAEKPEPLASPCAGETLDQRSLTERQTSAP